MLGSRSLLLLDGRDHLRHRRLMLPSFHGERLRGLRRPDARIALEEIETWPSGAAAAMQPRMQAITLEIILRVVFGLEQARERDRCAIASRCSTLRTSPMGLSQLLPKRASAAARPARQVRRARRPVDEALYEEIRARRAAPDLASATTSSPCSPRPRDEDGAPLTDRELRDELITLLIAGHETTATALAWACERLCARPPRSTRVEAEAAAGETTYTDAVVAETLRLRQPIPIVARRAAEPYELMGHELPAGTVIAPCIYLVHRRPDVYPDPYAFRPRAVHRAPARDLPGCRSEAACGAASALASRTYEMRVVLHAVVERLRLAATEASRAGPAPVDRAGARPRRARDGATTRAGLLRLPGPS